APPAAPRAAAGAPVMLLPGAEPEPQQVVAMPPPAAATADAFSLHLASYRRQQDAVDGWAALRAQAPGALSGMQPGTSRFTRGADGEFIRLKAGPIASRSEADALCAQLRAAGLYCDVQPYAGTVPF
ncbi:MAG: SPOR domain-containing protein, partial [Proteobacteria bacterium]|nr:SPOR domain-containing protein [Pseudomonadota bacterium]